MRRLEYRKYPYVVISDVRFPNELRFIRDNGVICVYLERTAPPDDTRAAWHRHISEHAVRKWWFDRVVQNRDILDLRIQIEQLMLDIGKRSNCMPAPLFQRWLGRLCSGHSRCEPA